MQNGEGTAETEETAAGTKNQTSSHHNISRATVRQQKDGGWWFVLRSLGGCTGGWMGSGGLTKFGPYSSISSIENLFNIRFSI